MLDWAKAVFRQLPENEAFEYVEKLLGGLHVYSFASMFRVDDDHPPRECPQTMEDVGGWFSDMYDQGQANGPHHIQLLTDDDELEMAVYVFDDHYRATNPGKADFLLLDGWESRWARPIARSPNSQTRLSRTRRWRRGERCTRFLCLGRIPVT